MNRSPKDSPRHTVGNCDFLLASTSDYLRQFKHFETVSMAALRKLLPWQCSVEGAHYAVVENVTEDTFFVAICGAAGLVVQDYWISPYAKQDALRFCFSLIDELFASPLDFNLDSAVFCTPYAEDTCFGAIDNSYRILWHFMALGNPIYTLAHIRKCLDHALFSARSTRKPVRVVLITPHWERWDEREGVELVCLLKAKKFAFLAPQSALGFKDRSTGARFDVSILLVQNQAAAKHRPVTQQGLARVSRAFGKAVDDAGVRVRRKTHRTGSLMSGSRIPAANEFWRLLSKMPCLARGVLDRNVAVGFGVCVRLYQDWLRAERDGGNYALVEFDGVEVVRQMKLRYSLAGLDQVATFFLDGSFGVLYLMVKHKDTSLCEKRRPVVPCFNAPDKMLQNRVGRALCFLIDQLDGHFSVAATQEICGRLSGFNSAIEAGDTVMAASFDVKELYVMLKPAVLLEATEFVVTRAMGDRPGVLVNTRGRKGVSWFEAGTPQRVAVKMTASQMLAGVRFILENGFRFVAGSLVRQVSGIGIGGGASPGLAQCVCVFGEMQWTMSLGADRRLAGAKILGTRLMDDCCTLLVAWDGDGDVERRGAMREIFSGYLHSCYPEGMTVELTSDGLTWVFCGMQLTVGTGGVSAKMVTKNVQAGVAGREGFLFFPFVSYHSDCSRVQKMASTVNALYRVDRHCSTDGLKAAAIVDVLRELRWQGYPKGWLFEAMERMVSRTPLGFWHHLLRRLESSEMRL
ncbi:hypothetical protein CYMTET_55923 [Cymbomonas tetramitiformis]|uniref:Uncharacterized protein n=1 Tax=Cymbomonas tetramitiformis TaxID=36881 RepID=A0AAE0EN44_9CHLO|nr:hypothetical protein CYMTET_55923 [Cymbomonas tetramitiformis]